MIECKICNKEFNKLLGLSIHLIKQHNISLLEYRIKYENFEIPKCVICDSKVSNRCSIIYNKTCGNKECINKYHSLYIKTSDETKEKLRKARFDYLKTHNNPSAFERKQNGDMSYLEEWFYDKIIQEYKLYEKYDIVNELPEYPYFIDFAFLNIKLAVEIDGRQHFRFESRIQSDIKKDKLLKEKGWLIYRIRYDEINQKTINDFLYYLDNIKEIGQKIFEYKIYKYKEIKFTIKKHRRKYGNREQYNNAIKNKYNESQQKYIPLIENSSIDFSKFGWVNEVAKIINKQSQKVNKWMKRFMPKFYEEKCFKRNDKLKK